MTPEMEIESVEHYSQFEQSTPTAYIHTWINLDSVRAQIAWAREHFPNVKEVVIEIDGVKHEMSVEEFVGRLTMELPK